ncbi:MAG: hypothetical protein IT371_08330 [Deltaproteobacteria bacterium]|nr:hypothetical protein [Deltaproteobacteria bacterium]
MTQAFFTEPYMRWVIPEDALWEKKAHWLYTRILRLCVGRVRLYEGRERLGLGTMYPPGVSPFYSFFKQLQVGLLVAPFRVGWKETGRLTRLAEGVNRLHKMVRTDAHWYLDYAGVVPSAQGQGIGSELVRQRLRDVDAAGQPCYVMTAQPALPPRYAQFGFEVLHEGPVCDDGPKNWLLHREARPKPQPA